jgi:hypothetical protein
MDGTVIDRILSSAPIQEQAGTGGGTEWPSFCQDRAAGVATGSRLPAETCVTHYVISI